jgi:sortase A
MRRLARTVGLLLIVAGVATLGWTFVVWQWEDPFTSLYTAVEQHQLEDAWAEQLARAGEQGAQTASIGPAEIAAAAHAYRKSLRRGAVVGRLRVPRLDLDVFVVNGTDTDSLKRGPGRYARSFVPGERRLIYVAGHRTTYGAPFAQIDRLRRGDRVFFEVPYGTFEYRVVGHRIVSATDVGVLRSKHWEQLALQACHPRFFASHRYIAYAQPVRVTARDGASYRLPGAQLAAAQSER